jgi:hypothetical protein
VENGWLGGGGTDQRLSFLTIAIGSSGHKAANIVVEAYMSERRRNRFVALAASCRRIPGDLGNV